MSRVSRALLLLTAIQACNAEPIPSITTPPLVSFAPLGQIQAVLVVGRDGAAPALADVEIQNESTGARVALRAGSGGDFSAQLDANVGDSLRVVRRDGVNEIDLARASSPDADAATIPEPGSASGTSVTLVKESGDFLIVGTAGAVPGGALVVVSPVGASVVAEIVADAAGAFSIALEKDRLEGGSGDDAEFVGIVAIVGSNVSRALLLPTDDDGTSDGTDDGIEDGSDDGTDGGVDDGTDGSTDDGTDDGTGGRDGGPSDDATDGTDDGTDSTDDGTDDGTDTTDTEPDDGTDSSGGTDDTTDAATDGTDGTDVVDDGTDTADSGLDDGTDTTEDGTDSTDDATDVGTDTTDDGT